MHPSAEKKQLLRAVVLVSRRTAAGGSKLFGHKDGEDDGYAGAVGFLSEKVGDTTVMFAGKWGPPEFEKFEVVNL